MRYIFKNYAGFAKNNRSLFLLAIITIWISAMILHLSYGVYQNAHIIWKGNYDTETSNNYIEFTFSTDKGKEVTKADLTRCFNRIVDSMDIIQASGNSDFVLFDGYTPLDWGYPTETLSSSDRQRADPNIKLVIDSGGLRAPAIIFDNMLKYGFSNGGRWTDEDEASGRQVALFWDYQAQESPSDDFVSPECALNEDGSVTIDGKKYEIIGYQNFFLPPLIPYGSLDANVVFSSGKFVFREWVSVTSYATITDILKEELGDRVQILHEQRSHEEDAHYTYSAAITIVILLALIAVTDLLIVYQYYVKRNEYKRCIFRICGMSRWKAIGIQFGECLLLTIPVYVIAAVTFAFGILPRLTPYFVYMKYSFSPQIYAAIFGIYIACTSICCLIALWIENHRHTIVDIYGGN